MLEIRRDVATPGEARAAYDRLYTRRGIRHLDSFYLWVLGLLPTEPGRRLLDVACGEGSLLRLAARRGLAPYGVELSPVAAARSRQRGVRVALADGQSLPFAASSFDLVTNIGSLEHYLDPAAGAAEMARVLRPGGLALVLLPNTYSLLENIYSVWRRGLPYDDGQPIQRYASRGQWARLLETAGLRIIRIVKYEQARPRTWRDLAWYIFHPKKLAYVLLSPLVPTNLANCLVFLCTR